MNARIVIDKVPMSNDTVRRCGENINFEAPIINAESRGLSMMNNGEWYTIGDSGMC